MDVVQKPRPTRRLARRAPGPQGGLGLLLATFVLLSSACAATKSPSVDLFGSPSGGALADLSAFTTGGQPASWTLLEGGVVEVRPDAGNLVSKETFGDARFALEFWCPAMPRELGIDRGNSGVYVQGRYEVQVLDSYEMPIALNSCGAIYQISAPAVNASLPPETWQSYVIDFRAARFEEGGAVTENPRMSVWLNGVLIQDDVELPAPTPGGLGSDTVARGPLMLQAHSHLVRYRNLSVTPRNESKDGSRVGFSFGAGVLID